MSTKNKQIVILDDWQNAISNLKAFDLLKGFDVKVLTAVGISQSDLIEECKDANVIVPVRERTELNAEIISSLPNLRLISQSGKGCSHIDISECTERGVLVAASGGSSYAPAELTWGLILSAMRNLHQEVPNAHAGKWQAGSIGRQLNGRTLGIYGYGNIGSIVAEYGKAFGMDVIIWGGEGSKSRAQQDGYDVAASKNEFFANSDVLSVHIRLSKDSMGVITEADLKLMKPDSLFVNTSRADLVQEGALVRALKNSTPGFAAVDTYESEPTYDHPLFGMKNVICSPHLGYVEKDTYEIFFKGAFENILAFFKGSPTNIVNSEALEKR